MTAPKPTTRWARREVTVRFECDPAESTRTQPYGSQRTYGLTTVAATIDLNKPETDAIAGMRLSVHGVYYKQDGSPGKAEARDSYARLDSVDDATAETIRTVMIETYQEEVR